MSLKEAKLLGGVLIVAGIILGIFSYTRRPISGLGDAFSRMAANPDAVVFAPSLYYGLMAISVILILVGASFFLRKD